MSAAETSQDLNFANLIWQAASAAPSRPVIEEDDAATTFEGLRDATAAMAESLRAAGVQPGDVVCILVRRGVAAAAAFFGTLAVGAVGCMINEAYRPRQIRFVLAHTGARVIVASGELWEPLGQDLPAGVIRLDPENIPPRGTFEPVARRADDEAQIIYTSGSTGQPKGVVSSHANLWAGARVVPAYLGLVESDRIASLLPFSFVYGFSQLACALVTRATLVIERSTLARDIIEGLRRARVTVLAGVPPLWMQLLAGGLELSPLPGLRVATCAGGKLAPELVRRFRACQPQARMFLMYGLTEVFRSTFLPPDELDAHPDSMGRAVPGAEVLVLREDGEPCAVGEVGELVHAGPTVALGYWRDPEGTARVFRPHPRQSASAPGARGVFSGDLVRRDEDGRLYYVGRRDRMIKTLGYRVSPDEVADAILTSGLVREVAVTAEADQQRGQRIVAHVALRDGASVVDLKRFCGIELPRYMQPGRYRAHDSLPRNATGKIDLVALESGY